MCFEEICKQDWTSKAHLIEITPALQRLTLVLANVNPSCSKFNTSSKDSTITFPLLPTVYHSWIAKANLRCGFSSARSLPSIFKCVSQSSGVLQHTVLAPWSCWNFDCERDLVLQLYSLLWTKCEPWGDFCPPTCLQLSLSPLGRILITLHSGAFKKHIFFVFLNEEKW